MKMFKKVISMALALCMLMIPITAKAAPGSDLTVDTRGNGTFNLIGGPTSELIEIYYVENTTGTQIMDASGSGTTTQGVKSDTKTTDSNGDLTFNFSVSNTCLVELYYTDNNGFSGYKTYSYTAPAGSTPSPTPTDTVAPTNSPALSASTQSTSAPAPVLASASNGLPTSACVGNVIDLTTLIPASQTIQSITVDEEYIQKDIPNNQLKVIKAPFEGKDISVSIDFSDSTSISGIIKVYGKLDTTKGLAIQDNHPSYRIYTAGETLDVTDLDTYVYIAYSLDSNGNPITNRENIKDKMVSSATSIFFSYSPSLTTPLTTDVTKVTCTFTYPNGLDLTTSLPAPFDVTVTSSSGITITPCSGKVGDTVNLVNLINPIEAQKDCVITLKDQLMSEVDKTKGDYKLEKAGTATFEVKRKNSDVVVGTVTINPLVTNFVVTDATKKTYQEGEYYNPDGMTGSADIQTDTQGTTTQKKDFVPKTDFEFTPSLSTGLKTSDNAVTVKYLGETSSYSPAITVQVLSALDKPTIQVTGSKTDKTRSVSMNCTNALGTILYTTDGTDPKSSSTYKQYTGAFDVTASTTIKAYVMATNSSSQTIKSEVETMSIVVSEKKGTVYNCRTSVNVRSGPGTNYSKIGVAKKGTVYSITGESGNWYQIDYNGTTGYISKSYMKVTTTGGDLTGTGTIVNCKHKVNVRKGPGTNYGRRGYAYLGETYNLLALDHDSQGRDWYMVQYGTTTGYIYGKYIQTSATPTPITSKNVKVSNCSQWVNVRSGPSTSYAKVGRAYLGDVYALEDWYGGNGFAKVTYVNKVTGEVRAASYISTKYLTPSN